MTEKLGAESEAVERPRVDAEDARDFQPDCDLQPENGGIVFMMAAYRDPAQRPDLAEFVQIEPRNLSATSISFYSLEAPPTDSLVVLMGKLEEDPIYVSAVVTSCDEGIWERKRRYLVGCELTGRL